MFNMLNLGQVLASYSSLFKSNSLKTVDSPQWLSEKFSLSPGPWVIRISLGAAPLVMIVIVTLTVHMLVIVLSFVSSKSIARAEQNAYYY